MIIELIHGGLIVYFWLAIFRLIAYHYPNSTIGKLLIFAN